MRTAGLVVFPGVIVFSALVPWLAGRVFWTVMIAALPLFIVIAGYHRWRRICPLAFVSQLPARFGWAGSRRAGPWLQAQGFRVCFAIFLASLWLRLVATNGDGLAIAAFLCAICALSFAVGLVFTGKSWCNYMCPVSFVEKIYTEPRGLRDTPNSQCAKCTACKPACPDINEESSYWKELFLPAKRQVYFSFPGVVFAFYFYYYLQAGTWSYYFGGRWTNDVGLIRRAFLPGSDHVTAGFFFWPAVPRAVASASTLLLGAAASLAIFSAIEPRVAALLKKRNAADGDAATRHVMFTLAAFTAFVIFYSFAGAPTLRLIPGVPHAFQIIVVTTATAFLARRLGRRQSAFAEETLARRIIAKWPWKDTPPPRDLREAFLIHTIRSQSHEESRHHVLEMYKSAVRDTIDSGVVSRAEVHRLESLRNEMRISESDHERVMAELAEEESGPGKTLLVSPEKHLQLETYAEALAVHLERQRADGATADDAFMRSLREEYAVTEDEHAAVLDRLVRSREGIAAHMLDAPASVEIALGTSVLLDSIRSAAARFLANLLRRRAERIVDGVLQTVGGDKGQADAIRAGWLSTDPAARQAAVTALGQRLSPATAARLADARRRAMQELVELPNLPGRLRMHFTSPDPYIRASALYMLESIDEVGEADYAALENDEHPCVHEAARVGRRFVAGRTLMAQPTVLAKMIGLKSIGIFDGLEPEDLAQLARAGRESWFTEGRELCHEGELGDEVFVLLDGEVSITRREGDETRLVAVEGPGSVIGELAVLDPAPREATVTASTVAVRVLRLSGQAFRNALSASPAVSDIIIRMLARRLRAGMPGPLPVEHLQPKEP